MLDIPEQQREGKNHSGSRPRYWVYDRKLQSARLKSQKPCSARLPRNDGTGCGIRRVAPGPAGSAEARAARPRGAGRRGERRRGPAPAGAAGPKPGPKRSPNPRQRAGPRSPKNPLDPSNARGGLRPGRRPLHPLALSPSPPGPGARAAEALVSTHGRPKGGTRGGKWPPLRRSDLGVCFARRGARPLGRANGRPARRFAAAPPGAER